VRHVIVLIDSLVMEVTSGLFTECRYDLGSENGYHSGANQSNPLTISMSL
jgi:hypothetical protein